MNSARYRVGVDIGGTFTDIVFISPEGELGRFSKKPKSTHTISTKFCTAQQ